ncbi:MAG: hypothetical protein PHV02_12005 [Rhodocyclaceae bacterium]|nr:hypothetical protein [Rhodocyclaceae bacterium]
MTEDHWKQIAAVLQKANEQSSAVLAPATGDATIWRIADDQDQNGDTEFVRIYPGRPHP